MSRFCCKSVLLITAMAGAFSSKSINALSSSERGCEMSKTASTRPAFKIRSFARSTPIFSTVSSVMCMPAVSERLRGISPSITLSSIISRVVPGIFVTIERSVPESKFIKVDFPTLGLPAITVLTPSRMILPVS